MIQKLFTSPVILDSNIHKDVKIKALNNYEFTKEISYLPIGLNEFLEASKSLYIVFATQGKEFIPVVLLGNKKNFMLNKEYQWRNHIYIPLVIRAYPFGVSEIDNNRRVIIIDEKSPIISKEEGVSLFEGNNPKTSTKNVIDFTSYVYKQLTLTKNFTNKLQELGLFVPAKISISTKTEQFELGTFYVIDQNKLKQLNTKQLRQLLNLDYLNYIYIHLNSLKNSYELSSI